MKSSRLLKYFEEYIKKIDMNNAWSKAKYFHSLKSMDLARIIASNFNIFNEEELVVNFNSGIFHENKFWDIVEYAIKKLAKDDISMEEFIDNYNTLLKDNSIEIMPIYD